jgi:hypothetical protein
VAFGLFDGPEKTMQPVVEVQPLAAFPKASRAVAVTLNDVPAVCVPGFDTVKKAKLAELTVTALLSTVTAALVAVRV